MHVYHVCVWCLWRSDPLELEFQMVVSLHVHVGNHAQAFCKRSKGTQALNHFSSLEGALLLLVTDV